MVEDIAQLRLRIIELLLQVFRLLVQTSDVNRKFLLLSLQLGFHFFPWYHHEHFSNTFVEVHVLLDGTDLLYRKM